VTARGILAPLAEPDAVAEALARELASLPPETSLPPIN
jgi:hypothetical protein